MLEEDKESIPLNQEDEDKKKNDEENFGGFTVMAIAAAASIITVGILAFKFLAKK